MFDTTRTYKVTYHHPRGSILGRDVCLSDAAFRDRKALGAQLRKAGVLSTGARVTAFRGEAGGRISLERRTPHSSLESLPVILECIPSDQPHTRAAMSEAAARLIIEICPKEPRTSACLMNGDEVPADPEVAQHLADCNTSGDCEQACLYVVRHVGVVFRIVARNAAGEYENRLATSEEKAATARAIYFESEADFDDESTVDTYLVWDAARDAGEES